MNDLTEVLSDFRVNQRPKKAGVAPYKPRYEQSILAFDQSLSQTGWAFIQGGVVIETGVVKTPESTKGHEGNLTRGVTLAQEFRSLLSKFTPSLVVHETPPAGGGMVRPEASLLAAQALRIEADGQGIPVRMIGAQKAKNRWVGSPKAEKRAVKAAMFQIQPNLARIKPMNQNVTDAIALGFIAAEVGV